MAPRGVPRKDLTKRMQTRSLQNLALLCLLTITTAMVETKVPVGGSSETSPLVRATAPPESEVEDVLVVEESTQVSNETAAPNLEHDRMVGAGVASGVVGLLLGGPFFGILLGFGAAWAADKEGAAGDASRAVGEVALLAKSKAREVDSKHNLVLRSKVAASEAWERAKEVDRRHNVLEKTKGFVVFSWEKVLEINREHRLLERSVEAFGRAIGFVLTQISEKLRQNDGGGRNSPDSWTEVEVATATVEDQDQDIDAKK